MFRSSPPILDEEVTDDEIPLLEEAEHRSPPSSMVNPPATTLANSQSTLATSMECLHSPIYPLRAYFSPNSPRKPRSKSHSHAGCPPLPLATSWRRSVDLPRAPPPTARASEEEMRLKEWDKKRDMGEVTKRQQTEYLRAIVFKRQDQRCRRQGEGPRQKPEREIQRSVPVNMGVLGLVQDGSPDQDNIEKRYDEDIERLLAPVSSALKRLRDTKIPPYNARLNVKSGAQVLRDRLLPIGKHVLQLLPSEKEERRGELEVRICRYIAENYWPMEIVEKDHMGVMEMYRNAVFVDELATGRRAEQEREVKGG
ncbi:hypothetical protein EJ07DRAFT_183351 [Lizonia empirigonia]|nr:hypothetical protein EJ07DRAFT_183351 [Lizonia empirigonia]